MFKCNSCGELKERSKMQRVASDHNVCLSCKQRYQQKGLWDIKGFKASNEWELKEMIDNFLATLMDTIHAPIEQCSCCGGTGYMQDIK